MTPIWNDVKGVPFCRQVTAAAFKPVNRIQLSDIAALQKTNENGEFVRIYLGDSKESYALTTWGGIVPITRKVVPNDDLQALTRIPAGLGIAAATLESGDNLTLTAPYDVLSGGGFKVSNVFGVAANDTLSGNNVESRRASCPSTRTWRSRSKPAKFSGSGR